MKRMKLRKSFVANIILVFIIFNIISAALFSYYIKQQEEARAIEYARNSLQEIVKEKSELISGSFREIEGQVNLLEAYMTEILKNYPSQQRLSDDYEINIEKGIITRKPIDGVPEVSRSCIIGPYKEEKRETIIEEINLTENLDKYFEQILKTSDVTWAYIITKDNLLRCSPYSSVEIFGTDHNQIEDTFYQIANEKNNPERKTLWTKPYNDYLGTGWTMTCTKPIYDKEDNMYGVVCLDIAINNIKEKYFSKFSIGKSGKIYWMDKGGNILYITGNADEKVKEGTLYEKNIFDMQTMGAEKRIVFQKALNGNKNVYEYVDGEKGKTLVCSPISYTDSVLVIELDNHEFASSSKILYANLLALALFDILVSIVLAVLLYSKFSKPMKELIKDAEKISNGIYEKEDKEKTKKGFYEIIQLKKAFQSMKENIFRYTDTLKKQNQDIETIIKTIEGTLMIVDTDGNIILSSKESEGIEFLFANEYKEAISRVSKENKFYSENIVINNKIYRNIYYPIGDETNKVERVVISSEDITKTTLMEKELQQIEKMAGVGQLAAAIVHELKNSLTLINGAAYILEITAGYKESDLKEVKIIRDAVNEAENVIDTLLDYSRRDYKGGELIHMATIVKQILLLEKKPL